MKLPVMQVTEPGWGIRLPPTATAPALPLHTVSLPPVLHVSLHQHSGVAARPLVQPGDRVLRGQPIGAVAEGTLGARVHAPAAGMITALGPQQTAGRSPAPCVTIATEQSDERWQGYTPRSDPLRLPTAELRHLVIEGGIVGLGGATFPTGLKLNRGSGINTLIINGAECEPIIRCDDALLQSAALEVLQGARIMLRILEAEHCIIALKDSMLAAREAVERAADTIADDRFSLALLPSVYPVGGEGQLIQLLTGREIPSGGLPWDSGAICQNVGTAVAVARMLYQGEPLIRRVVTVAGAGIVNPGNFDVLLGTPIAALLAATGSDVNAKTLLMGGPMMGVPLTGAMAAVTKACNCVFVPGDAADTRPPEQPCIRCGECARVCPVQLTPQLLLQARRNNDFDRLESLGVRDCIECGCCDYVCPSRIELTRGFAAGKRALWERAAEQRRARNAERRIAARAEREAEAAARREAELEALTEPLAGAGAAPDEALRALLERTARKRQKPPPEDQGS